MKEKRGVAAAVMHNGKLHVFGGNSVSSNLQTTEKLQNIDIDIYEENRSFQIKKILSNSFF